MAGLGAPELLIILAVVLLLFGSAKLPKLARSLGQAQKEFKSGLSEGGKDADAKDSKDSKDGKDPKDGDQS
jgi:sec-independent protein translocase protein TatA